MDTLNKKGEILTTLNNLGYNIFTYEDVFIAFNSYTLFNKYPFMMEISINKENPFVFIKGCVYLLDGNISCCCKSVPYNFINDTKMSFKQLLMSVMNEICDQLKDLFKP